MWRIILRILIFFVHISYIFSLVVFPFKISENKGKTFEIRNDLHSKTYLGDSKQLTDLFFYSEEHLYFIDDESCKGENFFIKNFSEYNTSNYIIDLEENQKAVEIREIIYLYKDLNLSKIEKIENFPFLVKIKQSTLKQSKGCFLLGILYRTNEEQRKINFLEQLKIRNLINKYIWTFKYINEREGLFIIGEEPHIYDPINYNESNYLVTNPQINPYSYGWTLTFDKLYSGEDLVENSINARISFSNNYILSDPHYNKTIKEQFFNEYLEKKICYFKYLSFGHCYYYCDKNKFKKDDLNKFPILNIIITQLEMNFTFKGEELFYEGNDYYYFKLHFMDYSQGGWVIGQLFLNKYQLIFDNDEKTIGYYNKDRQSQDKGGKDKNNKNSFFPPLSDNIILYVLIPLIIIVLGAIIFILIKFDICHKKRKKLMNELDDEDNEDYFNINSDKNENNEIKNKIDDERKLYKSSE